MRVCAEGLLKAMPLFAMLGLVAMQCRGVSAAGGLAEPSGEDKAVELVDAQYIEMDYSFSMKRVNMERGGQGKLWLSFSGDKMLMRLEGKAHSPRFGDGKITIVVDPVEEVLYAKFDLKTLHESRCLKYNFPNPDNYQQQMAKIKWRADHPEFPHTEWAKRLFRVGSSFKTQWTKSNVLSLGIGKNGQLKKIEIVRTKPPNRVVKSVQVNGRLNTEDSVPPFGSEKFEAPSSNCQDAETARDPEAELELKPPHGKSSLLNDLLLTMKQYSKPEWRFFLIISALAVPGDVAVLIQDPEPPDFNKLGGVAFDYTSKIIRAGKQLQSNGSIWMDVANRDFHLRGEAKATKLGPLFMDLIARGGSEAKIYANVDLTVSERQQCVQYAFPQIDNSKENQLAGDSRKPVFFSDVDTINGEDCGVFVAYLPRGRSIYVWVDMEGDIPEQILRSEIRRGSKVLRKTDILRWHTPDQYRKRNFFAPEAKWNCGPERSDGNLADLGISNAHKRSMELQEALYSLTNLPQNYSVLEVLALTGDVAIYVSAPEPPNFGTLSGFTARYATDMTKMDKSWHHGQGQIHVDFSNKHPWIQLLAEAHSDIGFISIDIAKDALYFRVGSLAKSWLWTDRSATCLKIPSIASFLDALRASGDPGVCDAGSQTGANGDNLGSLMRSGAIFDHVEAIGATECNRFTYVGITACDHTVDLWQSIEVEEIRRFKVMPLMSSTDSDMLQTVVDLYEWQQAKGDQPLMSDREMERPDPSKCVEVKPGSVQWLENLRDLPDATSLNELSAGLSTVGLLEPRARAVISILFGEHDASRWIGAGGETGAPDGSGFLPPSDGTLPGTNANAPPAPAPNVDLMSSGLKYFSFEFESSWPMQQRGNEPQGGANPPHHRGTGNMRVDLDKRQFFIHSTAANVSSGIPKVESRIIFSGLRGKLYTHTYIEAEKFAHCWTVNTDEALPPPPGGKQPNPFLRARNSDPGLYSVSGASEKGATKYTISMGPTKGADLYVDTDGKTLRQVVMHDLEQGSSTLVNIKKWSTAAVDQKWFEASAEWDCGDFPKRVTLTKHLAKWDIMQLFFPTEVADQYDEPVQQPWRRLEHMV